MIDSTEPSRTRLNAARLAFGSLFLAGVLTSFPVAAQQVQDSGPPTTSVRVTQTPYVASAAPTAPAVAINNGRKSLEFYNEGTVACRFKYDSIPVTSTTVGQSTGQPLPAGYDVHVDANAVTPQSVWITCPQATQIDITEGQ